MNTICILRVIEGEKKGQKYQDFEVPAVYLNVSGTFSSKVSQGVELPSDGKIILLYDSVAAVEVLVGWMVRRKGFEIDESNMKDLARLSDKYKIESLQKDVRVLPSCTLLISQNFTQNLIVRRISPSFDLWKFAARYSLFELEGYCLRDSGVFAVIKSFVRFPAERGGFMAFVHYHIPEATLNALAKKLLEDRSCKERCRSQQACVRGQEITEYVRGEAVYKMYDDGICPDCAKKLGVI